MQIDWRLKSRLYLYRKLIGKIIVELIAPASIVAFISIVATLSVRATIWFLNAVL